MAQLAANLTANALTHGDPGAPVNFDARTVDDQFVAPPAMTDQVFPWAASRSAAFFRPARQSGGNPLLSSSFTDLFSLKYTRRPGLFDEVMYTIA